MKKMRGKIGDLLILEHKFPLWLSNLGSSRLIFDIQIYCDVKLEFLLMEYLIERGFNARYLYDKKTVFYTIGKKEKIKEELETLVRDKLAEIDFNKFDEICWKVSKQFLIERLKGGECNE